MDFLQMIREKEQNTRITIENLIDYAPEPENFSYICKAFQLGIVFPSFVAVPQTTAKMVRIIRIGLQLVVCEYSRFDSIRESVADS